MTSAVSAEPAKPAHDVSASAGATATSPMRTRRSERGNVAR